MNISARMIIVLTLVGLISGSLLAVVGLLTKDRIAYNKQQEINAAIFKVLPDSDTSEELFKEDNFTVYRGKNSKGNLIGFAIYTSGTGFQDVITLMFGIDANVTKINSLTILEQKETPGLGAKITDKDVFLKFWENKDISNPLMLRKPAVSSPEELSAYEVNTITGATISANKVLRIVNKSLEKLKQIKQAGKLISEDNDAE